VLNTWIGADPNNVAARIQVAVELYRSQRRTDESLALVRKLFEQRPDDMNVVASLKLLFEAAGQTQQAIDLLEAERAKHPGNRIAVEVLVDIYSEQKRLSDATRIVDAARAAVADDADLLYYVAHLYQQIDQQQTSEQVLEQVLKLDPTHAQAGNDLGYTWADEGKNLDRAEALIRLAVNAEPDNPSYLDSLGWVLYKRGHFDEALKLLEQASQPAESADPVVLNHLGDVLYRLTRSDDARHAWRQSLTGIEGQRAPRQDLVNLRLELQNKLRASEAGQPVNVAPVVESPPSKEQAKN
jgi:tetratricopeptide (TPR) repeat protein